MQSYYMQNAAKSQIRYRKKKKKTVLQGIQIGL